MQYTADTLYGRIREVMREKQCDERAAVAFIHDELSKKPEELKEWWSVLGTWWLHAMTQEIWNNGGPHRLQMMWPVPTTVSDPTPTAEASAPTNPSSRSASWRANVNPMDIELPVGKTGVRKRIGDFTRADVLTMRDYYHAQGRRLIAEGDRWGTFAEQMKDAEVLEQAMRRVSAEEDEGKLPKPLRKALSVPKTP